MATETRPAEGDRTSETEARVCPSCGKPPGAAVHCKHCGTNLIWRWKLPTRRQWGKRAQPEKSDPPSARGELRYLPRDLKQVYDGPSEEKHGWLMLALALNEMLGPQERVTRVFSSTVLSISNWWLVVTSERLLSLPANSVIFYHRDKRSYRASEVSDPRSRRRLTGSRASFRVKGDKVWYPLKGRRTGQRLIEAMENSWRT